MAVRGGLAVVGDRKRSGEEIGQRDGARDASDRGQGGLSSQLFQHTKCIPRTERRERERERERERDGGRSRRVCQVALISIPAVFPFSRSASPRHYHPFPSLATTDFEGERDSDSERDREFEKRENEACNGDDETSYRAARNPAKERTVVSRERERERERKRRRETKGDIARGG